MAEPTDPKNQVNKTSDFESLKPEDVQPAIEAIDDLEASTNSLLETTDKFNSATAELNRLQKEQKEFIKENGNVTKKLQQARKELSDEYAKGIHVDLERTSNLKVEIEILKKLKDEEFTRRTDILLTTDNLEEYNKKIKEHAEAQKKAQKDIKKLGLDPTKIASDFDGAKKSLEGASNSINTIQSALNKSLGAGGGFLGEIYRSVTSASKAMSQLGAASNNVGGYTKVLTNSLAKASEGLAKIGGLAGAFAIGLVVQLGKMALGVNNLSKQLAKATGFGDKFNEEIVEIAKQGNMAGISFQESADALGALTQGLSSFNPNAEETNVHLGLTVARLKELGVDSATATKSIDHMQRAMGMTAEQAADTTAQLARMGKEIVITGVKMINDFNAASSRLAIYGDRNIEVFKGMAAMAKASGIEIQNLISISKQFDQFDEATKKVASLNAVLGTQLSTLELMAVDGPERIMLIKQQVQASVGNFDSLDKFTKQYIAQAMGVASVDEAQRLLNMSTAEYQKYQQNQQEQADIQRELADATERVVPFMQALKIAGLELLMAFSPLISTFANLIGIFTPAIGMFAKFLAAIAPLALTIMGVVKAMAAFGAAGTLLSMGPIGWTIAAIVGLVAAFNQLYDMLHKSGSPMLYQMFDFIAGAVGRMAAALVSPITMVKGLADGFTSMFGALHDENASKSFDIAAVANIDMDKVAAGISKVKSALVELSSVKVSGMVAFSTDGANTSMIMGSVATEMAMLLSGGKLEVDVKIPEMKMPDVHVKVYIGDRELRDIIRTEVSSVVGAAG